MMKSGMSISKTRNWAFIVYPESAPDGWMDLLAATHLSAFISPLHNRDTDEDGVLKKPHYHAIIMTDGPITQKRANELIEPYCGTKSAEYVKSLRGYVRYLAHLDDPDKAQYDPSEIIAFGEANLTDILKLNLSDNDKYQIIGEIMRYCEESEIHELSALTKYAMSERSDWLPVIVEKSYFITQFLASLRYSNRR
jgi:hypothetical protein